MEGNTNKTRKAKAEEMNEGGMINPLRKEKVIVRFVPRRGGYGSDDPKHVMYGGMAENVEHKFCVPILASTGTYKNVLTNEEKEFLENALGLDYNALSVYRKVDNYWENYLVSVGKRGMTLDLSDPEDYIKYKVLLANDTYIAPNVEALQERPKATYRFVLVKAVDEAALENAKMNATMECYKEFGKIDNDIDTMRVLVEILDGRPYAANTKLDFLRARCNNLIQANANAFLSAIKDPLLRTKTIIRLAQELGKVAKRGNNYCLTSTGEPLCDLGDEATLPVAARWLNKPVNMDIKALLESDIAKSKE